MPLKFMYATNNPIVAKVADEVGVDRIWVDLETMGKEERQKGMDTLKSHHTMEDISVIRKVLTNSKLLVRVNPMYEGTKAEVDEAIARGADILMLPMFRTAEDAARFVDMIAGRARVLLLLETVDAERNVHGIVKVPGVDEIHIGINDLHLEHHQSFLFELLADGTVDRLCGVIREAGLPYGFGGITKLDGGALPGRQVIAEHYRLGSSMAILSKSFFDAQIHTDIEDVKQVFSADFKAIRDYEKRLSNESKKFFENNRLQVSEVVRQIITNKLG